VAVPNYERFKLTTVLS
jgi:G protein-coupled receptor kinase